ncbi:hypothetical protein [Methylibium rhizosphaerae]|uniref:hypothetical protein n=1 Tax=Methylibium rhizosphaerae TaxID=2570323 RepID=UPI00112B1EE1|nr:hypothetical protein [Methylibium rhizosphaerae]
MDPNTERKRMSFDKTIISNALTILAMFGGLTVTYAQFSARVSVLESELVRQRETDKRHEAEAELLKREIREELRDIKDDLRRAADAVERRNRSARETQ